MSLLGMWPSTSTVELATPSKEDTVFAAAQLMQFAYDHGRQSDSYLSTAPGRETFWSADRGGLVSYKRVGRHVLVSGGLIAPPSERPRLLKEFLQFTASRRWRATFFCILEEDLPIYRDAGYCVNKFGEDAKIILGNVTFAGKRYEWVRRQSNYCHRHGVKFEELRIQDYSHREWIEIQSDIEEVGRDAMRGKPQTGELTFFDGTLGDHPLGYRRLFVARRQTEGHSRIEGYVVCNPIRQGCAWSTEIYRHRFDAVRGTVPFLFHQIALQLQQEGVTELNLCIVPARNCEQPIPGDKAMIRHGLLFFRKYFSVLYDLQGIDHFKSRFRPHYENSYLCSPPEPSIGAILATFRVFGLLRISPLKMLQIIWGRLRKQRTHARSPSRKVAMDHVVGKK